MISKDVPKRWLDVLLKGCYRSFRAVLTEFDVEILPIRRLNEILLDTPRELKVSKPEADGVLDDSIPVSYGGKQPRLKEASIYKAEPSRGPSLIEKHVGFGGVPASDGVFEVAEHSTNRSRCCDRAAEPATAHRQKKIKRARTRLDVLRRGEQRDQTTGCSCAHSL